MKRNIIGPVLCALVFAFIAILPSQAAASGGLQFDGVNDTVTFGRAASLGVTQFTIETWFKRTGPGVTASSGSGGLTAAVPLMAKGRGEADGSTMDMNWFLGISGDKLAADFEDMATGLNHPVTGSTTLAYDRWYHAAATYDGTTWQLYLDGVLEGTLTVNATPRSDSIQHASLASALDSTGAAVGYFQGVLDEPRVWNYARSGAEIASSRLTPIASASGLVGRWALDETTGSVAANSANSAVPGTLTGGPAWTAGSPMVPAPTVSLVSPADQAVVPGPSVTFSCQAVDELGLVSATLYRGQPARSFTFSGPAQTEDSYLDASTPNSNFGSATSVNVDGDIHAHALIRFPNVFGTGSGQVPPGTAIATATLRVNCFNLGNLMKAYRLTQAWDENTATWNQASSGVSWLNAGADGLSSHAAQAWDADCTVTGWRTIDLTALVQEWSNGSENFGLVLVDSGIDGVDINTSESATPPELIITLQPAQPLIAVETQTFPTPSPTSATASFTVALQDATDYEWNCLVVNSSGQQAWAPANFRLTVDGNYPGFPILSAPAHGGTGVATSPTLEVGVSDPNANPLTVQFYGRAVQSGDRDFTMVVLPDTQNYSEFYPNIFTAQTTWIRNQVLGENALNIVFVAQEGDLVNTANTLQYDRANTSLSLLDDVVPYGLLRGNHDTSSTLFNQYFPYTRYQNQPWYGGHYGSNNDNNFQTFTVGSLKFLVLHLSFMPSADVIAWAQGVIGTHGDHKVVIVTHAYIDEAGNLTNGLDGTPTKYIWDGLVEPYPNVCMVLCGHEHIEITRIDPTADGRLVPQLLADYQAYPNGGNGFLRLLRFSPSQNTVSVRTYSPYLNEYETDSDSEFTLDVPMNGFKLIGTQSGVASGTTASTVWPDLALGAAYEWRVVVTDSTGRSTEGPVWSFTTRATANASPIVTIASPVEGAVFPADPAAVTLTANASDPDGQVVQVEFFSSSTVLGVDSTEPFEISASLAAGDHTITAAATDDLGGRAVSAPVHINVGGPLSAPADLAASAPSSSSIVLSWTDASANEIGFKVYYKSPSDLSYSLFATVGANSTSAQITGLQHSTTYTFMVSAFNSAGETESAVASGTTATPPPVPAPPTGLTAASWSASEISLAWTDNSASETGFQIERSLDRSQWTMAGNVPANTTSTLDAGLASGTVYYYRVSACGESGCSAPSNETAAAPYIDAFANGETLVAGTLVGSRANTYAADEVYEQLTEKLSGGKANVRYSTLEHKWTFTVTPGRSLTFYLQAHQSASSDGDNFQFAYSTDGINYLNMVTVSATAPGGSYQEYVLPSTLQGTVHVRVKDTDQTVGKVALDTLYVDGLVIRTDVSPLMAPPAAPVLQQAVPGNMTVSLAWSASSGATSYSIGRKLTGVSEYAVIASGIPGTTFTDTGLENGTTYRYVVVAENEFGPSEVSNELSATPSTPEPVVIASPSGLTAIGGKRKITLTWVQSSTPGVTQNRIYRSNDGGNYALLATIPAATTYSDSVSTGSTQYYYVTAVSVDGESAVSQPAHATAR